MASEYTALAGGRDLFGKPWEVGTRGGLLVVAFGEFSRIFDDSAGEEGGSADRERFAEAVARAVTPGQASRVKHGPWCGCTPCKADDGYARRRAEAHGAVSGE